MALAIFLDGESKSGKTAVGRAIASALEQNNYSTSPIIVGNFFRRVTALALAGRPSHASEDWLEPTVRKVLADEEIYKSDYDASALDTPEIDALVSSVGQLDFVQAAAGPWREKAADQALASGAEVVMLDGRNLRLKFAAWLAGNHVPVALELVIVCRAEVAASRYLADSGNASPTSQALAAATEMINQRRRADRSRAKAAYIDPENPVTLVAGIDNAEGALALAFAASVSNPPRPILFDNSEVPRETGLATVSQLALLAIKRTT